MYLIFNFKSYTFCRHFRQLQPAGFPVSVHLDVAKEVIDVMKRKYPAEEWPGPCWATGDFPEGFSPSKSSSPEVKAVFFFGPKKWGKDDKRINLPEKVAEFLGANFAVGFWRLVSFNSNNKVMGVYFKSTNPTSSV